MELRIDRVKRMFSVSAPLVLAAFAAFGATQGCSDDADGSNTVADSGADGADGANADSTTDTTTDTGSPDSATTEASSDTGAAVTDASDSATDTKPTDAGTAADCLDASAMAPYFTLKDDTKCLVARYDVATASVGELTWGRHGGPLGFIGGATPSLVRYQVPSTATGTITVSKTDVPVSGVASGVFWGGSAYDLPFFGWTAFSYSATGAGYPGELLIVDTAGALTRYHVNGFFAAGALSLMSGSGGRVLYTGVSPISTMAMTTNEGGLYAADSCGSASTTPRLLPGTDTSCKDPIKVATWEAGSSGPVAVDPNENLFAILSTFGGKQELRGFERSTVARGAGPTSGTKLFSLDGYTQELVADGKSAYFQAYDGTTFSALDVQGIAYTVETTGKTVTPKGSPTTFLQMTTPGTVVSLVRDDLARIWVAVSVPAPADAGDAGVGSTMFFVLRDKTP